jgi:hypothetical protein
MHKKRTEPITELLEFCLRHPRQSTRLLQMLPFIFRGMSYAREWEVAAMQETASPASDDQRAPRPPNPLRSFFESHHEGRGIYKWSHYFDIYHRHFSKFIGREVHVLEVGAYSGGSLQMWREYFGPKCLVYGVDIQEECRVYEDQWTKIIVGDQADRRFWKRFKKGLCAGI